MSEPNWKQRAIDTRNYLERVAGVALCCRRRNTKEYMEYLKEVIAEAEWAMSLWCPVCDDSGVMEYPDLDGSTSTVPCVCRETVATEQAKGAR